MPFVKTPNVAMYKGSDWSNYIKTVPQCAPELARRIANLDPDISFFFVCREPMVLENPQWPEDKSFSAGDAVFFSGDPWWGSAPQCDGYLKDGLSIAYIKPTEEDVAKAGEYKTAQGLNAVDVVCLFAANLNSTVQDGMMRLAPDVPVPENGALAVMNTPWMPTLKTSIKPLQDQGILVLLTVLGNHDAAGWSNFENNAKGQENAQAFANQLSETVKLYGLDGIDIDDEYSSPDLRLPTSLAMVSSMIRKTFKEAGQEAILTKALYDDEAYFQNNYNNVSLADSLTYGAFMAYGANPDGTLSKYVDYGMEKNSLLMGYWDKHSNGNPVSEVEYLKTNGYAGTMVFAFEDIDGGNQRLLGQLVCDWMGPGNWVKS